MESKIRQSIIKTVLYFDIFDYPLTSAQIWKYLMIQTTKKNFDKQLLSIKSPVEEKDGWYFLTGRENLIKKRLRRIKISQLKLGKAYEIASILSRVPTVLFIGVSGGVSMHNASKNDDIDIFVITKKNSIWLTRFFIITLLKLMGKHRGRKDKKVSDKICLNMLIDEDGLIFPKDRQDLYTAHEIVQMKPVLNRNKTYEKFISSNRWLEKFLPNATIKKSIKIRQKKINLPIYIVEFFAKIFQLWYIKRHISRETIKNEMLAFHPIDYKGKVMKAYGERLKKYGQKI